MRNIKLTIEYDGSRYQGWSRLGKNESEISKWMRGTHNFTIDTLVSIENVLGEPIIEVCYSQAAHEPLAV